MSEVAIATPASRIIFIISKSLWFESVSLWFETQASATAQSERSVTIALKSTGVATGPDVGNPNSTSIDAIQESIASQKQTAAGNDRAGVERAAIVELVVGQLLEFGLGGQNVRAPSSGDNV